MGFTTKAKSSSSEGWGMGFFLVFFPEEDPININPNKTNLISSSSTQSSSAYKTTITTLLRRTNSTLLLTKAQSTISICAILIFTTLLLFTLSTFEPTTTTHLTSRRHLSSKSTQFKTHKNSPWPIKFLNSNAHFAPQITSKSPLSPHALQGMGTLFTRGTTAMNDLIIGHVSISVELNEFRLFLRLLLRSGLTSKSDLLFIFPSTSLISFDSAIREENESFLTLVHHYKELNCKNMNSVASFGVTQFVKSSKKEKERGEPIWGRRIRRNYSEDGESESTQLSYGSVVGFEVDELDPENSLFGFLDHVPMSLRRWACYPMLLGRVRRNFKHVMLVDVKDVLLLGDALGRVRNRSPESVYLSTMTQSIPSKHGKKNSDKQPVNPAVIMGGVRGVRRLSNAMLTEIVRAATHKRKNSVSDSGLLSQLVGNEFILKNINLVLSAESIQDTSSLSEFSLNSHSSFSLSNYTVVRRGNSYIELNATIMKHICSFPLDSSVYSDC